MSSSGWVPVRLEIRGYGGAGPQGLEVELDRPILVLQGPNGSGKSTILSAMEWALFGELRLPADFDLSELKGPGSGPRLVYLNRDAAAIEVTVQFQRDGSSLVWRRVRERGEGSRQRQDAVEALLDGSPAAPASALSKPAERDEVLRRLLGVDHELYARVIAPGQASLLGLLAAEGTERDRALDRLLGIEELNLLTAGTSRARADLVRTVGRLERQLREATARLEREIQDRFQRRQEARRRALEAGIARGELDLDGGRRLTAELAGELDLPAPSAQAALPELRLSQKGLLRAADEAWEDPRPRERRERLARVQRLLEGELGAWVQALRARSAARAALQELIDKTGTEPELAESLAQAEERLDAARRALSQANLELAILSQVQEWLAAHRDGHPEQVDCPVCEQAIPLEELEAALGRRLSPLQEGGGELQELGETIAAAEGEVARLRGQRQRLSDAAAALNQREESASARRARVPGLLEEALAPWREREPEAAEAPVVALLRQIQAEFGLAREEETAGRLETLGERLRGALAATDRELGDAGREARQRRQRVLALGDLLDFLGAEERLAELDALVSGEELVHARAAVLQARQAAEALALAAEAAGEVAVREAERRVTVLEPLLDHWFRRLSRHDRLKRARIRVQTQRPGGRIRNAYRLRAVDPDGLWEAGPGPQLSGGYHTLLVVAALLALVEAEGRQLDLLVLDEPTLSLDPELSARLAQALAESRGVGRLVVATAEPAFARALVEASPEHSRLLELAPWTRSGGVRVLG